jgi:hypothetical protein
VTLHDPTLEAVTAAIEAADFHHPSDRDDADRHARMAAAALAATWSRPPSWLSQLLVCAADLTRLTAVADRRRDRANVAGILAALASAPARLRSPRQQPAVAPPGVTHASVEPERRAVAVGG